MNVDKVPNKTLTNRARNTITTGYKTTRNAATATYTRFRGLSTLVQVLIVVAIIIVLILLIIWIYNMVREAQYRSSQSPFIITTPVNAFRRDGRSIKNKSIPNPVDGLEFTYSFWIYVANWNYRFGDWKNILLKGNNNTRAPGIWLYPKTNSLHCRISTFPDLNEGCDIRNIPLQKWVHVVYVLNNRTVDIYIDGKLERSCVLRGVPILNNQNLRVANDGGFWGQIAKMQYFTRAITPYEVSQIYSEGPYISGRFKIFGGDENKNGDDGDGGDDGDICPTDNSDMFNVDDSDNF